MAYEHQIIQDLNDAELDIALRGVFLLAEACKENKRLRESLDVVAMQALKKRLTQEGARRDELSQMSFDECEGGACKL